MSAIRKRSVQQQAKFELMLVVRAALIQYVRSPDGQNKFPDGRVFIPTDTCAQLFSRGSVWEFSVREKVS